MKKSLIIFMIGLMFISYTSAMNIDYFYSLNCGHCQKIAPFIQEVINNYPSVTWQLLDISQGSFNIQGTPTLKIKTNDCRNIELKGSYEIPKYILCEINEISTKECPTTTQLNPETKSFFIR